MASPQSQVEDVGSKIIALGKKLQADELPSLKAVQTTKKTRSMKETDTMYVVCVCVCVGV